MSEELPSREIKEIIRQQIVDALKFNGIKKQEVLKLLQDWTKQEEKKVATPEDRINLDRKRAHVYFEAGYPEEALNSFEAALTQAWNEQRIKLYNEISKEKQEIEEKLR